MAVMGSYGSVKKRRMSFIETVFYNENFPLLVLAIGAFLALKISEDQK